jgi:hypothetical protein
VKGCWGGSIAVVSPRADLFHQLLAATKRRRKITKPPSLGRAPFNQVSNFGRAPFNQVSNFGRAPFNQVGNIGAPLSVSKTKMLSSPHFNWKFPLHLTWPGASSSYLPQQLILTPPPPHTEARGTYTPLLLFWAWCPLMRPRGLNMAIRRYHRRSDWSQDHNGRYFSSWNDFTVKKSASKSSAVSAQEGGIL